MEHSEQDPGVDRDGAGLPTNRILSPSRDAAPAHFPFLFPPVESDEIGRLGNYRVLRLLGMGGMGMVFHAEDIALCRPVALKVMRPDLEGSGASNQRFLREARAMAAIKHDHLVTVFQAGQENGAVYLAMELLHGETLEDWLQRTDRIEVGDILRLGREIATGLAAIHQRGLVHRDIQPANLWLEVPGGRVKILDFGLVRAAGEDTRLTTSGTVVGTPAFLSPEQARGRALDARSDLFSLGCVLYCLCTRQVPFPAANTLDQLAALAADPPVPVRERNPRIPGPLARLVEELLAKDPEDRPASAAEVAERLLRIKRSLSSRGKKLSAGTAKRTGQRPAAEARPTKRLPFRRRHPIIFLLLLVLCTLASLAGAGMVRLLALAPEPKVSPRTGPSRAAGQEAGLAKVFLSELDKLQTVNWPFHKPPGPGAPPPPPEVFGPVSVQGQVSPHGIFMHAAPPEDTPASISYALAGRYREFRSRASLNDTSPGCPAPLILSVYGDEKLLWRSGEIRSQEQTQECVVPLDGVNVLKLEVLATGNVRGAHAVWLEPTLTRK